MLKTTYDKNHINLFTKPTNDRWTPQITADH